jgi:hypothetical protein
MMEAESTSETSLSFYQNTRRNIPEDGHVEVLILFHFIQSYEMQN